MLIKAIDIPTLKSSFVVRGAYGQQLLVAVDQKGNV